MGQFTGFNGLSRDDLLSIMSSAIRERFFSKIDVRGSNDCWPWIPKPNSKGYGDARIASINNVSYRMMAHRAALMLSGVDVKNTQVVDHICRNKRCCNPKHLRAVSPRENALENSVSVTAINAVKTHCKHGHALSSQRDKSGKRKCSVCNKIKYNEWYKSKDGQMYHFHKYNTNHGYKTTLERKKASQRTFLTAFNKTQSISEWALEYNQLQSTIHGRIKRGWDVERAISEKPDPNSRWHKDKA